MEGSCGIQYQPFYDGFSTITLVISGIGAIAFAVIFAWCAVDMAKLHRELSRTEAALSLMKRNDGGRY
ncbi:hypothetical protein PRIPAC_90889 [Pristionchus pacificus]|uniref:Uncharacterized protein n=1 Tax=Pristionchus pacificus TaxID=54126 RepID=A0A2A6CZ61_PRIPA|nr:hypothetical protein PRIPAC_90889 [Pristionchus pacificus]|eukprot:PDM83321.1 hypothetical protein PRIPAC_34953 [Pristionchus pacificus]